MPALLPPLLIRTDANSKIGTGHLMRCIALAQTWRNRGGEVFLFGEIEKKSLLNRLEEEGVQYTQLNRLHPDPEDSEAILQWITGHCGPRGWIVIDGYQFDLRCQNALRKSGWPVMIIDDYAHHAQYNVDILVNQNIGSEKIQYSINHDASLLRGCQYALLRQEFRSCPKNKCTAANKKILVTFGGSDTENFTAKIIEALDNLPQNNIEVKIVIGATNRNNELLKEKLKAVTYQNELLCDVGDMASLMAWADFAISAAGSTCLELAYMGVPGALIILAENQKNLAEEMAAIGAAVNCGWQHEFVSKRFIETIDQILKDQDRLSRMREAGHKLVDGFGVLRVTNYMLKKDIVLRKVRPEDSRLIFEWANEPDARKASFCINGISWEEHSRWFQKKLDDPDCYFLISSIANQDFGQVRLEFVDGEFCISVNLDKKFRKRGLGCLLIAKACELLVDHFGTVTFKALIKSDNSHSVKTFQKTGFTHVGEQLINHELAHIYKLIKTR